jgi:site-specific DNA-methyltransferase (cytosine-N4-specific)
MNAEGQKVPYTQQFSPKQTPLKHLLPILRQHEGNGPALRVALASAFFKDKADPDKLTGNTLISLHTYGLLDGAALTVFGKQLIALQAHEDEAHRLIAKRILIELGGTGIVETLREMKAARLPISLASLPGELRQRGFTVSSNSSDLSGILGWLREAKLLQGYAVNETEYSTLLGIQTNIVDALKGLSTPQVAFMRAMVALNVTDWTSYSPIAKHAEALYAGEVAYNWKEVVSRVLNPLRDAGLIELRKPAKVATDSPQGRGGKPLDIRPMAKFEKQIAEPILGALYRSAGFANIREIRSKSLADIVTQVDRGPDQNTRAKALELLTIRLCQMLDLTFMGWRETDVQITGGGEVDAMMHAARLIYSRWQVQCKVGPIPMEAVAKEVGVQQISLANVILCVGTKPATAHAVMYRRQIVSTSSLNIILLDGPRLARVIEDNTRLIGILREQAEEALRMKPTPVGIRTTPPSGGEPPDAGQGAIPEEDVPKSPSSPGGLPQPAYQTPLGRMFHGDSLEVIPALADAGVRVKLIITSPPFALVRKKAYGNEDADRYVEWFERFVPHFKRILDPSGSLVIDIGGSWIQGLPVKSTYQFKLLLRICESGFYLAQDFYHYNPAKLPTPAEWVTIRRLRVKDAVNNVFWLTRDPFVEADNRQVLHDYSDDMKDLLKNGYKPKMRPSGHDISDKFNKDNGGAIPPNLFQFANTASTSHYMRRCAGEGIKPHPARFPGALPAFFIKLLTKPGDVVLDPFAGSNVTGEVAESLSRQWIGIELNADYVAGSKFRFEQPPQPADEPVPRRETPAAGLSLTPTLPLFGGAT